MVWELIKKIAGGALAAAGVLTLAVIAFYVSFEGNIVITLIGDVNIRFDLLGFKFPLVAAADTFDIFIKRGW